MDNGTYLYSFPVVYSIFLVLTQQQQKLMRSTADSVSARTVMAAPTVIPTMASPGMPLSVGG